MRLDRPFAQPCTCSAALEAPPRSRLLQRGHRVAAFLVAATALVLGPFEAARAEGATITWVVTGSQIPPNSNFPGNAIGTISGHVTTSDQCLPETCSGLPCCFYPLTTAHIFDSAFGRQIDIVGNQVQPDFFVLDDRMQLSDSFGLELIYRRGGYFLELVPADRFYFSTQHARSHPPTDTVGGYFTVAKTVVDESVKLQATILAINLNDVAMRYDVAGIVAAGPTNLPLGVSIEVAVKVFAKVVAGNDQVFADTIELSVGTVQFMKAIFGGLTKTNVVAIPLWADSLIFSAAALISDQVANDPPDMDFTTVVQPQPLDFPSTNNTVVDQAISHYLDYISLQAAVLHAGERWQGAKAAADETSANLQLAAYQTYSAQAATIEAGLQAVNASMRAALPPVSIKSFPGGRKAIAAAFNAQCGQPLDPDANAALLGLGVDQSMIDSMICEVANSIRPKDINANVGAALAKKLP